MDATEAYIEQLKILEEKLEHTIARIVQTENYTVGGIAALYAWFFTQWPSISAIGSISRHVFWIPAILAILSLISHRMHRDFVRHLSEYIRKVEGILFGQGSSKGAPVGFARYYLDHRTGTADFFRWAFWFIICSSTILFAGFVSLCAPKLAG